MATYNCFNKKVKCFDNRISPHVSPPTRLVLWTGLERCHDDGVGLVCSRTKGDGRDGQCSLETNARYFHLAEHQRATRADDATSGALLLIILHQVKSTARTRADPEP